MVEITENPKNQKPEKKKLLSVCGAKVTRKGISKHEESI
jgi:hypothetical protein